MGRRSRIVCVALTAVLAHSGEASATVVASGPCVLTASWAFSPPLTRAIQTGTLEITAQATCVGIQASSSPPGESVQVTGGPSRASFTYFGNCVMAQITGFDVVATLIGGSVLAVSSFDSSRVPEGTVSTFASGWVMTPNEVCNESSASGVAVGGPFGFED